MNSLSKRFKIFTVVALALVLVGMIVLGIFGFNNTVDFKGGYEVKVHVNQYTATDNTIDVAKSATEKYFSDNGLKATAYSQQADGTGLDLIYKFTSDVTEKCGGLEEAVQTALTEKAEVTGLTATASVLRFDAVSGGKSLIILAICLSAVALFVYALFAVRLSGAVTVICTSVIGILLYTALISIFRVPVDPTGDVGAALVFALSEILSIVLAHRFKETSIVRDDLTVEEVADLGVKQGLLRLIFIACAVAAASVILIAVGPAYIRLLGVQLLIASASSFFAAFAFTSTLYVATNKNRNK